MSYNNNMKLIVGLGNPGKKYKNTRHNVGFEVVEGIFKDLDIDRWESKKRHRAKIAFAGNILLTKPQTFMNKSGESVGSLASYYKIPMDEIFVVYDDLDLLLGESKMQRGKGPKDHNGLNSVIKSLGTNHFWHVRIGIDNRDQGQKIPGEAYVLEKFNREEKPIVARSVKETVHKLLRMLKDD